METFCSPVEIRETEAGKTLHGILIQEGRVGSQRREIFSPLSLMWSSTGVAIRTEHRGVEVARAIPKRETNGEIRISAPASEDIVAAYEEGKRFLSIEFHALQESRSGSGVREISEAFLPAVAMVSNPEFSQAVSEVRSRGHRRIWL